MVEEKKESIFRIAQTIIGSLVVASILGLAGSIISVRDAVLQHDIVLESLVDFGPKSGDWFTASMGRIEREARINTDVQLSKQIAETHKLLSGDTSREHQRIGFLTDNIERLEKDMNIILRAVQQRNVEAQKWITVIERNTEIIKDNQRSAHTH